ncbi:hypothetical protein U9M48_003235 [Paspalum notatum var. saurae]|uniref:Transposase-associated domain-containing protein n=1 Tax=Paspalum notatum var. saurae TaxID=547442 RepID=A0AAQ3PSI1_PASNO
MADDRQWMYDGFDKTRGKAHSAEWRKKTQDFIDHAFAGKTHYLDQVRCPCNEHNNGKFVTKEELTKHLVNYGFMPSYETWSFHGEKETRFETEVEADDDLAGVDRMDEMLEALQPEFCLNSKDPPPKEVEEFFKLLQASEEPLHEHTKVSLLAFVTWLLAIESKYFFSNKCFNDLVQLIGDVLPQPHKLPNDMYQCKRLTKALGMGYEKIDMCLDGCMLFCDDHVDKKKCLYCSKGRYVEVINEDGDQVTMAVAQKQLRSFPMAPRFKQLFLSTKTCEPMRWPKEGVRDNPGFMGHPADSDAWKALDEFDPEFAKDARNIRFGLATDGFIPFGQSAASYSCWPMFVTKNQRDVATLDQRVETTVGEEDEEVEEAEAEAEDAGDRQEDEDAGDGHEDAQADEDLMGGDGSEEVVIQRRGTRKSHYVHPPPIPATADKILIRPIGDCQWKDVTWDGIGHRRTPNSLLGNLIRVHNPEVVQKDDETIPVTTWKHYALAPHVTYGSVQGQIRHKFWNYYRVDPSEQDHASKVLESAAKKICKDLFSNIRLQVTNCWHKSQGQPLGRFHDASEMYLTAKQYASVSHPLFQDQPGPYKALCDLWASKGFQVRSKKHRNVGTKNATHKLGGDGYHRKAQRSVAATGEAPSAVDMYIMAHRGPDPSQPELLCTPLAIEQLAEYGKDMERRHGEGFDWRNAPVDPQAVYDSGGGKSHGRYTMFNGMIDLRQVQRGSSSQSLGGSSSRQCRTTSEMEMDSLRQEIQKRDAFLKAQEEYQREQQAHAERLHAQQMTAIQALYQA